MSKLVKEREKIMNKISENDMFTVVNSVELLEKSVREGDNPLVKHDYMMVEQLGGALIGGDEIVDKLEKVIKGRPDFVNGIGPRGGTNHKVTASRTVYHWLDRGVIVKLAA